MKGYHALPASSPVSRECLSWAPLPSSLLLTPNKHLLAYQHLLPSRHKLAAGVTPAPNPSWLHVLQYYSVSLPAVSLAGPGRANFLPSSIKGTTSQGLTCTLTPGIVISGVSCFWWCQCSFNGKNNWRHQIYKMAPIRMGNIDSRAHYFLTSHDYEHWPLHTDEFQSLWVIIYFLLCL